MTNIEIARQIKERAEKAVAFDSVDHDGEDIFKALRIAGWWIEKAGLELPDHEAQVCHLARHIALALQAEREEAQGKFIEQIKAEITSREQAPTSFMSPERFVDRWWNLIGNHCREFTQDLRSVLNDERERLARLCQEQADAITADPELMAGDAVHLAAAYAQAALMIRARGEK